MKPGCENCRSHLDRIIRRKLTPPHNDLFCGDCGANEKEVYDFLLDFTRDDGMWK